MESEQPGGDRVASGERERGREVASDYTIDELSQASGLPSRTIRFYQAEGVLPWPVKRGRIAVYNAVHLERLQAIAVMQARGLQLTAIRDLLSLDAPERLSVWQWLGVYDEALGPIAEERVELTADELVEHLGTDRTDVLPALEVIGLVERLPEGRFRIPFPRLLEISLEFHDAGLPVDTSGELADILVSHLTRAAEEILSFAQARIGTSFPASADPEGVMRILETIDRRVIEAVGILWADVMRNAVQEYRSSLEEAFGVLDPPA